uniref:DRBM domain-containing protein n=1 Tax=Zooxanthella nutricula TaxID=1333877 RepID=A0A7S2PZ83_9DINO
MSSSWPDAASALLAGGSAEMALATMGAPTAPVVNGDPKSTLNMFVQRHCKKIITKEDIVYSTLSSNGQYQATVTVACLDGVQFAGEIARTAKDAEKSAATMALTHYADEVAVALAQPKSTNNKKRKASAAGIGGGPTPGDLAGLGGGLPDGGLGAGLGLPGGGSGGAPNEAQDNARVKLNNVLMRVVKRSLTKEDVVYNIAQTTGGYQCTLAIPCLSGEWAGLQWAGDVASKKKQAEENAALQAMSTLISDPAVAAAMAAPPAPKQPYKGKGRGKGKGKGGGYGWQSSDMGMGMGGMGGMW